MSAWRRELELLSLVLGAAIFLALIWLGLELELQAALIVGESTYGSRAQAEISVGFGHAHLAAFQVPGILLHLLLALAAWLRQPRIRLLGFPVAELALGLWAAFVWPMWSSVNAHLVFPVLTMMVYFLIARRWPSPEAGVIRQPGDRANPQPGDLPASPAAGA